MSKPIGEQIKYWRKKRGMTQGELAERIGVFGKTTIYQYEKGVANPSTPVLAAIAEALDCTVEIIMKEKK